MVATKDDIPLKKQTSPKGVSGIEISGGIYQEDHLQSLRGPEWAKAADKMRTQDSQVKMILNAVSNPIRSATWEFTSADAMDEAANLQRDFVEFVLTCDMVRTWTVFINEVLSFIPFGHSVFEIIHKNVRNHPRFGDYTGIRALSWRSPKSLEEWRLDNKTGELTGVLQRSTGDFTNDVIIPADFLLVFTIDMEGNDFSATSKAWLRSVYGNYLLKQFLKKLKGIGHEKMTIGTPSGTVPSDASEEDENKFESMLRRYTSNENQFLKLPEGYSVEILRGAFDSSGLEMAIEAENQEMVRAFGANFLNLGQGITASGGSYALGADLSDFFLKGIQYIADLICGTINGRLIPHLVDINFGEQEKYPQLICSGVQDVGKELSEIISNYNQAGAIKVDDTLRVFLRKLHKLPPEDISEEGAQEDATQEETQAGSDDGQEAQETSTTDEPAGSEFPDPQTNERDVASDTQVTTADPFPVQEFQLSGRTIITQGAQGLQEVMALNLDFMANKLVTDIVNRFKNLPDTSKRKATQRIKVGGVNKYQKDLRATLTNLAAIAINEAQSEVGIPITKFADPLDIAVDIASGKAKARFPKLPKNARDKIQTMAQDISQAQSEDLENAAKFMFDKSVESTGDADIIAQDLKEATNERSKRFLSNAPITQASNLVNSVRLEVFLGQEAKKAGVVAFEFFNPNPVSEICKHLAGRIFSVDNKEAARNFPPLHFNCKSELRPINQGSPKAKRVDDQLGLKVTGNKANREKIENSIQFDDQQVMHRLSDIELRLTIQTLLFDRKFFSQSQAVLWSANHAFATTDVERNEEKVMIRQRDPDEFIEGTLIKIPITQGVFATAGQLREEFMPSQPMGPETVGFQTFQTLQQSTTLQTLIFSKENWTRQRAVQWARDHGFKSDKVDETPTSYRLRQRRPGDFVRGSFRTIDITTGLKAVIGRLKNGE